MDNVVFCVNCAYHSGLGTVHECRNVEYRGPQDLVTGEFESPHCRDCRDDALMCGPNGRGYMRRGHTE